MIAGGTILRLLDRAWPLMLGGLILVAGYGLIKDAQNAHYERGRIEVQAERDVEQLRFEKQLATAAADEIRRDAAAALAALKARDAELQRLRRLYDQLRQKAAAVPDDGCLDRRLPDDAGRLLRDRGEAGAGGDPIPSPGEPGAERGSGLDRGNLPRLARLHAAAAGSGRGERGGQACSQEGDRWGERWIETRFSST